MVRQLIMGAACMLGSAYVLYKMILKMRKCSREAVATVICTESKRVRSRRRSHTEYYPVVEFEVDGKLIQERAGISSRSASNYPEGRTLNIKYDPENPEKFVVKGKSSIPALLSAAFFLLCGAFLVYSSIRSF